MSNQDKRVIYKYVLDECPYDKDTGSYLVKMPIGSRVLHVDQHVRHGSSPVIWALCLHPHPENEPRAVPMEVRKLRIVCTGEPFDAKGSQHLGSFLLQGGLFVGHVFDFGVAS